MLAAGSSSRKTKKSVVFQSRSHNAAHALSAERDGDDLSIKSETGHHLASLFRPLKKKRVRERRIVKLTYRPGKTLRFPGTILEIDELEYEFRLFEELCEDDLKFFLRAVQLVSSSGKTADPWTADMCSGECSGEDQGRQIALMKMRVFSNCSVPEENKALLSVSYSHSPVSYNAFLKPILKGYAASRKDIKRLSESFRRLASVTVIVFAKRNGQVVREMGSSLISYGTCPQSGRFYVALNPFVTGAVFGVPLSGKTPYIDSRVFEQKGVAAVVLSWLSAWLQPGEKGKISLDELEEKVYGDRADNRKKRYWRHRQLRAALKKISGLSGWVVKEATEKTAVKCGFKGRKESEKKSLLNHQQLFVIYRLCPQRRMSSAR